MNYYAFCLIEHWLQFIYAVNYLLLHYLIFNIVCIVALIILLYIIFNYINYIDSLNWPQQFLRFISLHSNSQLFLFSVVFLRFLSYSSNHYNYYYCCCFSIFCLQIFCNARLQFFQFLFYTHFVSLLLLLFFTIHCSIGC